MIPLCRSASALLALVVLVRGTTAAAQTLPSGWRIVAGPGAGMERAYEASGLPAGQYLTIEQGPLQPRAGAAIDAWLTAAVTADLAPEGTWGPQPRPTNVTGDLMATVAREFQATSNRRGGRIYLGVSGGAGEAARVIRLDVPLGESAQGATARELMSELARQSITAQRSGGGGVAGRAPAGGPLLPRRFRRPPPRPWSLPSLPRRRPLLLLFHPAFPVLWPAVSPSHPSRRGRDRPTRGWAGRLILGGSPPADSAWSGPPRGARSRARPPASASRLLARADHGKYSHDPAAHGAGGSPGVPHRNRRGTYRTDGYALILTYQNGTVQRLPFVVEEKVPGRVGGVWMEGYLLTPPTK
ncbi:MAG: hypothetical protein U5K74_05685 [Gemmatimonadaceae bacterium]|nr:hypothetical protein [Gemmatimonadaceae bacterium]